MGAWGWRGLILFVTISGGEVRNWLVVWVTLLVNSLLGPALPLEGYPIWTATQEPQV